MPVTTFLDLLRAKVSIQVSLLDVESARRGLTAADNGTELLSFIASDRGVPPDRTAWVDRCARRCLFLKGESFYLRLLRSKQLVAEDKLLPILWQVRHAKDGKGLGETLVASGLVPRTTHEQLSAQANAALDRDNQAIASRYRERQYAGIERSSQTVTEVIKEAQAAPAGQGAQLAPGVEGTQILSHGVASGVVPLQGTPSQMDSAEVEKTQDLPPPMSASPRELAKTGLDLKYNIVRKLGEGGMGAVYLAFEPDDTARERPMALKVVLDLAKSKDAAARFKREILACSFCAHENIIEIYDASETDDGSYYMAMEYIEGEELSDILKKTGPLELKRVYTFVEQALEALQAIHSSNIVHRDVKPHNFRIWKDDKGEEHLKIVDFGIARILDAEDSGAGDQFFRTMGGKITGSPAYIAPESITEPEVDGRADLYSLGITIFRIATGRLPFVAKEPTEYLPMHLYTKPPSLSSVLPSAPPELGEMVAKLLEKVPSKRFQSANEVLEFLRTKVRPALFAGQPDAAKEDEVDTVNFVHPRVQAAMAPAVPPSPQGLGPPPAKRQPAAFAETADGEEDRDAMGFTLGDVGVNQLTDGEDIAAIAAKSGRVPIRKKKGKGKQAKPNKGNTGLVLGILIFMLVLVVGVLAVMHFVFHLF